MIFRSFILSLLLLSYGTIVGHEVIFGHHTTAEINCHHHGHDCCDHNHGDNDHIPCLVNIDPHVGVVHDLIIYPDEGPEIDLSIYLLVSILNPDLDLIEDRDRPPDKVIPELYNSLFKRSHGLRGPPIA